MKVVPPRDAEMAKAFREALGALSPEAYAQVVHAWNTWVATCENGREVLGVLNRRYDLCVLECASPAPWLAAAFDTRDRELVMAQFVPREQALDCRSCALLAARALDVPTTQLICDE